MSLRRRLPLRFPAALLGLGSLLLAPAVVRASDVQVQSHLEPAVIGLDGYALFTVEASGSGWSTPRLTPTFELRNLEIVGGPDQRHDVTFGSGGSGWHYSWTWQLRPRSVGPAAVESIRLQVGGERLDLAPRRLEVRRHAPPGSAPRSRSRLNQGRSPLEELLRRGLAGGAPGNPFEREPEPEPEPSRGSSVEPKIFLRAVADPLDPYVGQRVLYTVYLYTQMNVRGGGPESLPRFQGLWARTVDLGNPRREEVTWEGESYVRLPLLQRELYSLAAGPRDLEPVVAHFLVERVERDRFFFAPLRVPTQVERRSNPVHLRVRPLPPAPGPIAERFGGAVGKLRVEAKVAPHEVAAGQGATVTLTVSGEGHLESLPTPSLDLPPGLDVLESDAGPAVPATSDGTAAPDDDGSDVPADDEMTRTWRYVVVPRHAGSWRLPPVEVAYFDPQADEYRLARAPLPELVAARPAAAEKVAEKVAGAPLHSIRNAALPRRPPPRWRTVLPWAFAVPWVMAAALILGKRRLAKGHGGGASRAELAPFLAELGRARSEERPRRAAMAIEAAWRHRLSRTWGVEEGLPPARWPEELARRGAAAEACAGLESFLDDLHYLRYAPELSATGHLAGELVARSEALARELGRRPVPAATRRRAQTQVQAPGPAIARGTKPSHGARGA